MSATDLRSLAGLRDLIEYLPAVAWSVLPDGTYAFANNRWSEYTGLSVEETASRDWQATIHPEDVQRHMDKWYAAITNGEAMESEHGYGA